MNTKRARSKTARWNGAGSASNGISRADLDAYSFTDDDEETIRMPHEDLQNASFAINTLQQPTSESDFEETFGNDNDEYLYEELLQRERDQYMSEQTRNASFGLFDNNDISDDDEFNNATADGMNDLYQSINDDQLVATVNSGRADADLETSGGLGRRRHRRFSSSEESDASSDEDDNGTAIGQDDIFHYGETEDDSLLFPGSDVRVKRKGELWVQRNDMPLRAPFRDEYRAAYGTDKRTITWKVTPPTQAEVDDFALPKNAPEFIRLSGKMQHLKDCKDPLQFFKMIITDAITEEMLNYTNRYAHADNLDQHLGATAQEIFGEEEERSRRSPKEWRDVTEAELNAFFGAFLYLGEKHLQDDAVDDLFSVDMWNCNPLLLRCFSRDRFKDLCRYLRFDDKVDRPEKLSRLHKIAPIFDKIVSNCGSCFIPGLYVTIDEALVSFRGRVAFRMYMKGKPAKYGMKIYILSDARSGILLDAFIYAGKDGEELSNVDENVEANGTNDDEEPISVGAQAEIVLKLSKNLENSGRVVVIDRGFTSVAVAMELRNRGLHCLGTMNGSRCGIPDALRILNFTQYYNTALTRHKCEMKLCAKMGIDYSSLLETEENEAGPSNRRLESTRGTIPGTGASRGAKGSRRGGHGLVFTTNDATSRVQLDSRPPPETGHRQLLRLNIVRSSDGSFQVDHTSVVVEEIVAENLDAVGADAYAGGKKSKKQAKVEESHVAFLFSGPLTLCKFVAKKEKEKCPVYMVSTIHHKPEISTGKEGRPRSVLVYNKTKLGVDILDQMVGNYSCRRASFRWPCRIWFWLLDTAALTAYKAFIIANQGSPEGSMRRRDFIRHLALALMRPFYNLRERVRPLPKRTRNILLIIAAVQKYHNMFQKRKFSLNDSKTASQLMELAKSPCKDSLSIALDSNSQSMVGQSHQGTSTTASTPAETVRRRCATSGSRISADARRMYFPTPTAARISMQVDHSRPVQRDTRRRELCYGASCRKKRTSTASYCLLCDRPVCLTHGAATYDSRGQIINVTCRDSHPESYCLNEPAEGTKPSRRRKLSAIVGTED